MERERRERESITVGRPPGWSSVLVEKDLDFALVRSRKSLM